MRPSYEIEVVVVMDETDDPVITAEIATPAGRLKPMAEPEWTGRRLLLRGVHVQGEDVGPNQFGVLNLLRLGRAAMELLDVDEIVVEGEVRTSGASPGRRPRPLRFVRQVPPEV